MDYRYFQHPKQQVTVDNETVEQDCISAVVTLLENGLPSCNLVANNYKGKLYLQKVKLFSKVIVKFSYEDNGTINWNNVEPVFVGRIVDISPEMTSRGETLVATALSGECLKQVRVNKEYLTGVKEEVSISGDYYVNGRTARINGWTHVGTSPYLQLGDNDYISTPTSSNGAEDGDYDIADIPAYEDYNVQNITLNVRGRVTGGYYGVSYANITIKVWDGVNWTSFEGFQFVCDGWANKTLDVTGAINISQFNNLRIAVLLTGSNSNISTVLVSAVWFHIDGAGRNYYHYKLRDILQDVKNDCIDKLLGLTVNQPPDYTLNLDYVYNYDKDYPYMNFPFVDGMYTLNELIKIGSSMNYIDNPSNYKGLHWIVQYDNNIGQNRLIVAPVGNHSVYGANNSCYIENKWSATCPLNPIVVKEDMIQSNFKTEIPLANVVLVAGKFIHPKDDVWTEKLNEWSYSWRHSGGSSSVNLMLNNTIVVKGKSSLQFKIWISQLNKVWAILYRPLAVKFSKLVSKNTDAYINMQIYGKMKGVAVKLRLYCNNDAPQFIMFPPGFYSVPGRYFEHDLSLYLPVGGADKWRKIEIPVTHNDLDDVTKEGVWTAHNGAGYDPPSWDDIKWLVIYFETSMGNIISGNVDDWLFDDICIIGSVIGGAYTSDCHHDDINDCNIGCIKHYGIRTYTIKDSVAQTDSLDPNDDNNTLAQVALYELLRHRIPRTTATIQIPLIPCIKAGQIVHIKYNQLENGTYVIDKDFRITKVTHQYSVEGAKTILEITDDVRNSLPISTTDPYTVLLRAVNPDTQTKTFTSLKQAGSFETGMNVLWREYNV